ncbi:MAG TPA: hypothetical protein VNN17_04150 [Terriglobia bacterium]|nr:hypothetical protein [Terriglobia bacterium]
MSLVKVVSLPKNENLLAALKQGALLLRSNALTPDSVRLEKKLLGREWAVVCNRRPAEVDREITRAGWHLFFIPPELTATAIARDEHSATGRALAKLLAQAEAQGMNALEITGLSLKEWAGFYRVTVRGVLRHLQRSYLLFQERENSSLESWPAAA